MKGNIDLYNEVFRTIFCLDANVPLDTLQLKLSPQWDSVGHINLIAALEDTFQIDMDPVDMFELTTYEKGKELLSNKYGILFE